MREKLFEVVELQQTLQNFCERTGDKNFDKNVFSLKSKILFLIYENIEVAPSVLIKKLKVAKTNLANFCKQLEQNDLILSTKNETDHRAISYKLTEKGKDFVKNQVKIFDKFLCSFYSFEIENLFEKMSSVAKILKQKIE